MIVAFFSSAHSRANRNPDKVERRSGNFAGSPLSRDERIASGPGAALPVSHIASMADTKTSKPATSKCPICGKPADAVLRPFCSKRCADVDLHRWLSGVYVVPVTEDEEEDERRQE
jgi:endogenous inhibitor of DNA gyrase (YacG/DUF329 family)